LASGSGDKTIRIWDVTNGSTIPENDLKMTQKVIAQLKLNNPVILDKSSIKQSCTAANSTIKNNCIIEKCCVLT
jgi:WD40 repeat protein